MIPKEWSERYQQFVKDIEEHGFEWIMYKGRFFYEGPAVMSDEQSNMKNMQEIIRATKVQCQWDNLGLDYIVYPK